MGGNFSISNNLLLTALPTFNALTRVSGNLEIINNDALEVIEGFGALANITGRADIRDNAVLSSCCGLLRIANNTVTEGRTTSLGRNTAGCNTKDEIVNDCVPTLSISQNSDVPSGSADITGITGDLTIGGTITTFPDFTALRVVQGNLTIDGITTATLTNFANIFPALTQVQGNFIIQNNAHVTTITRTSFATLTSIGGDLTIASNASLRTFSGFAALTGIVGNVSVSSNGALSSCCGLLSIASGTLVPTGTTDISGNATGCASKDEIVNDCAPSLTITQNSDVPSNVADIKRITGNLTIGGTITTFPDFALLEVIQGNLTIDGITTAALSDLSTIFPALERISGDLQIQNNAHVTTITDFAELDNIGGTITIHSNAVLSDIPTFATIPTAKGVTISNNDALRSISLFASLTTTTVFNIAILDNDNLETLSGFDALKRVGDLSISRNNTLNAVLGFGALVRIFGNFQIKDNPMLSVCCGLLRFADDTAGVNNTPTIEGNVTGCNTKEEIAASCVASLTINDDTDVPSGSKNIKRITGNLTIGGTITTFPDFAALEVVGGNLTIDNITTATLINLADIFPALTEVQGSLIFRNNAQVETITGFANLSSIGEVSTF